MRLHGDAQFPGFRIAGYDGIRTDRALNSSCCLFLGFNLFSRTHGTDETNCEYTDKRFLHMNPPQAVIIDPNVRKHNCLFFSLNTERSESQFAFLDFVDICGSPCHVATGGEDNSNVVHILRENLQPNEDRYTCSFAKDQIGFHTLAEGAQHLKSIFR